MTRISGKWPKRLSGKKYRSKSFVGSTRRRGQARPEMYFTSPGPWPASGSYFYDVANMTRLINLWGTIVKRLNRCGWDIFIRSSSTFNDLRISQLSTPPRTSGNKFFTKIVSPSLALKIAYVKSLPNFHDHRWRSEQRPIRKLKAMRCLRTPVLWPWNDQAQICVRPMIFVRLPSLVNNTPTPTTHERS